MQVQTILKEISSLVSEGYEKSDVYVSINQNGQAIWGEAMALHADNMWDAMESAGFDPESAVSDMMTADEFIETYA